MLDCFHLPTDTGAADVQVFYGKSATAGGAFETWIKPRGKSMCQIVLIGKGGNGGSGATGANSLAAGGGGGGAGGQTVLNIPLALLPDVLFLSLIGITATTALSSYISIAPSIAAPVQILAIANGGGNGGNASAGTAGTAGLSAPIATLATMPMGWAFAFPLAGGAGIAGGVAVAPTNLSVPASGSWVTGGCGGGGLPAAAAAGSNGGSILTAVAGSPFFGVPGGVGPTVATNPGIDGSSGYIAMPKAGQLYGGGGGSSTHGTATGAGLVPGNGGNGMWGCGGGGGGGGLTGSTGSKGGQGGPAFAIITCW